MSTAASRLPRSAVEPPRVASRRPACRAWMRASPRLVAVRRRRLRPPGHLASARQRPALDELGVTPVGTLLCVHGNPTWSYLWRDSWPPRRIAAAQRLGRAGLAGHRRRSARDGLLGAHRRAARRSSAGRRSRRPHRHPRAHRPGRHGRTRLGRCRLDGLGGRPPRAARRRRAAEHRDPPARGPSHSLAAAPRARARRAGPRDRRPRPPSSRRRWRSRIRPSTPRSRTAIARRTARPTGAAASAPSSPTSPSTSARVVERARAHRRGRARAGRSRR